MNFADFVSEQLDRLGAISEWSLRITEAGRREIAKWLYETANDPTPKRKRQGASEWLRESAAAQRVKSVIDECVEFETPPGLADIKAVWRRVNPPANETRRNCQRCGGSGFIEVAGPYGTSAAFPCSHGPATERDSRMGVRIAPSVETHYQREAREAPVHREAWESSRANPNHPAHPHQRRMRERDMKQATVPAAILDAVAATDEQIAAIKQAQEANRRSV